MRKCVQRQFGIEVKADFDLIPLTNTHLLQPERWPLFTLLTQGLASAAVAWQGLRQLVPEVRAGLEPKYAFQSSCACV
jgi:hypothetical protein